MDEQVATTWPAVVAFVQGAASTAPPVAPCGHAEELARLRAALIAAQAEATNLRARIRAARGPLEGV